jgi:hypothetical protein
MTETIVEARATSRWWLASTAILAAWYAIPTLVGLVALGYLNFTAFAYGMKTKDFNESVAVLYQAAFYSMPIVIGIWLNTRIARIFSGRILSWTRSFRILREGNSFWIEGPLRKSDVYWILDYFEDERTRAKYGRVRVQFDKSTTTGMRLEHVSR